MISRATRAQLRALATDVPDTVDDDTRRDLIRWLVPLRLRRERVGHRRLAARSWGSR